MKIHIIILLLSFIFVVPVFAGVDFNDTDGVVNTAYNPNYSNTDDFSMSCWFKFNTFPTVAEEDILWGAQNAANGIIQLTFNCGVDCEKARTAVRDDSGNLDTATTTGDLTVGTWYHYIVVYDEDTSLTQYINGSANGQDAAIISTDGKDLSGDAFSIGARNNNGTDDGFSNVDITEFAFWEDVLTADEISTLYNSRQKGMPLMVSPDTLAAYYPMDSRPVGTEINGVTFVDASGNGEDGTGVETDASSFVGEERLGYTEAPIGQ